MKIIVIIIIACNMSLIQHKYMRACVHDNGDNDDNGNNDDA